MNSSIKAYLTHGSTKQKLQINFRLHMSNMKKSTEIVSPNQKHGADRYNPIKQQGKGEEKSRQRRFYFSFPPLYTIFLYFLPNARISTNGLYDSSFQPIDSRQTSNFHTFVRLNSFYSLFFFLVIGKLFFSLTLIRLLI